MASPSAVFEDRKSDDLEIVSVGALYSGSCDKKYWSTSRNGAESYSIDADTPDTSLKTVSCADALRTSKRGMAVATHGAGSSSSPEKKWNLMKWVSKLFKSGSNGGTAGGRTNHHPPQFQEDENMGKLE